MSTTSIFRLGANPEEIGETRNAWRGAMYVWNDIAKRYFGLETFPMFGPQQKQVWNAASTRRLPLHEAMVLLSTMDKATIRAEDINDVANLFEVYGREHPNSSLSEQASLLRKAQVSSGDLIAWQQTSVGEFWGQEWDEEFEEYRWYDTTKTDHFDAYAEAKAAVSSAQMKSEETQVS